MRSRAARFETVRALVVYKKSSYAIYQLEHRDPRLAQLLDAKDKAVARMLRTHEEHGATMKEVERVLTLLAIDAVYVHRAELLAMGANGSISAFDLVITVGGDGTALEASHFVAETPLLAVNSAPSDSVGHFAIANAASFESTVRRLLANDLPIVELWRAALWINAKRIRERILNEVLICHDCPAATSRYILTALGQTDEQRSSGIIIGPAAGSTASQRSAGGEILPLGSRDLQLLVREPYVAEGKVEPKIRRMRIPPGRRVSVRSKMREAACFVDGPHVRYAISFGDRLTVALDRCPLRLYSHGERKAM